MRKLKRIRKYPAGAREKAVGQRQKVGGKDQQGYGGGGTWRMQDQPVREFSGGMRQRTALLRALYSEWDVLFLDEPFKGLDEETKELVIEYTKKQCFGKTVIFVTHDRSEAGKMGGRLFKM